jgi:predicted HicB family RNase H-like nuclease
MEVYMSPISKAQQKAVAKYTKDNYDELKVRIPKGKKATIQSHAINTGETLNGFLNRAISETMDRDNEKLNMEPEKE